MAEETLVFAHKRWEIARQETNTVTGRQQWIRRDFSYICDVGNERASMVMPVKPTRKESEPRYPA